MMNARARPACNAWFTGGLALAVGVGLAAAAPAAAPEPTQYSAVLDLPADGFLLGRLVPAPAAPGQPRTTLLWQSPLFAEPLEFAIAGIERIRFAKARAAAAAPTWRADLRDGDFVAGELVGLDADHLEMLAEGVGNGPLRIPRGAVTRLSRAGAATRTVVPGSLDGWDAGRGAWQEQGGRITGDKAGSAAYRDVSAPARACFTLGLSWEERPDLDLLFAAAVGDTARLKAGAPAKKPAATEDYRIELAGGDLLAIREGATATFDLAASLPAGPGGITLQVFVDQERGRMAVVLPGDAPQPEPVFDQSIAPRKPAPRTGFGIRLRDGRVRIDSLRVTPWTEPEPRVAAGGELGGPDAVCESFDKAAGTFAVRGAEGPRTIAVADVTEIDFPAAAAASQPPAAGAVRAAFHGGTRLTGRVVEVTQDAVRLDCPAAAETVECGLKQLAVIEAVGGPAPMELPGRPGILETVGGRTLGCLANRAGPEAGIGWLPRGAVSPGRLVAPAEPLRIAYRGLAALGGVGIGLARQGTAWTVAEVIPGGPAARDGRVATGWKLESIRLEENGPQIAAGALKPDDVRGLLRGVAGSAVQVQFSDAAGQPQEIRLVRDASGRGDLAGAAEKDVLDKALKTHDARSPTAAAAGAGQATVYLKTGDSIQGTVLTAGPDGLHIKTDLAPDVLVPATVMRAVELLPSGVGSIPKDKLARLLTLPRMQQADPPTHMLRLPSGDYLRGKLVSLDGTVVRMNVLGTEKQFARGDVARLIWLSIEGDGAEQEALAAITGHAPPGGLPVRATTSDGRRLTMAAERVAGDRLVGSSGIFGTVGVDLRRCDRLELFPSAAATPGELPYSQWKLKPAAVPRLLQKKPDQAGGAPAVSPPGADHPLVGKRAAFPMLPLLDPPADGRAVSGPSDWEGQVVALVVVRAGEAGGVEALARLVKALAPLAADGVTVVPVAAGAPRDVVAKAVEGLPDRPRIALDQQAALEKILGQPALPVGVVIDRDGRVDAVVAAGEDDGAALRQRIAAVVERSQKTAAEFTTLAAARKAALAQDRACLESLGRLLDAESETVRMSTAALLRHLTGLAPAEMPFNPAAPRGDRTEQARRWRQWLAVEGITADLAFPKASQQGWPASRPLEGRTLVCRPGSRDIVELDPEGNEAFKVAAQGGWACDVLPNGHRLVGEHGGRAVVEYDDQGKEVWAVRGLPGGPMSARRLDSGNTLVALSDANLVAELDPQGTMAWSLKIEGRPCDARRLPDGTTLVAAHRGDRIVQVDAAGRELWATEIDDPQTAQPLPNGNILVAMSKPGIVREIDREGRSVWEKEGFQIPVDVQRLPDGTTLVQEQEGDLVELDPLGDEVKRTATGGSRILRW